jgi:hypothetical protein
MRFRSSLGLATIAPAVFLLGASLPGGALRADIDTSLFEWAAEQVRAGEIPYRDFALEYPPGALVPITTPELAGREHYDAAFVGFEAVAVIAALVLVFVGRRALGSTPAAAAAAATLAAAALLALGPVLLVRFDPWAALLTLAAVTALVSTRTNVGFALIALSAATKLYALVLVPPAWLLAPRRRALIAFVAAGALATLPFVVAGPGGVASSLQRQLGRGMELESLGASVLLLLDRVGATEVRVVTASGSFDVTGTLATPIVWLQTAALLGLLGVLYVLYARSRRDRVGFATTAAAVVTASVAFGKVLSPQFVVWVIVLVALVPGRRGAYASVAVLAASAITHAVYPGRHEALVAEDALPVWLLFARNLLLVTAAVVLVQCVRTLPPAARAAARGSCSGRRA